MVFIPFAKANADSIFVETTSEEIQPEAATSLTNGNSPTVEVLGTRAVLQEPISPPLPDGIVITATPPTKPQETPKLLTPIEKFNPNQIKPNPELGTYISATIRSMEDKDAIGLLKTAVIKLREQGIEIKDDDLIDRVKHTDELVVILNKFLVHKPERIREILQFCPNQKKFFSEIEPISTRNVGLVITDGPGYVLDNKRPRK